MLRTRVIRRNIALLIGRQQRQRQIMVDMRVHPRQCKLNPVNPLSKPRTQHRTPRTRHSRIPRQKTRHRPEIEPRKNDIEKQQPIRIFPPTRRRPQVDLFGHHQVKPIEPLQPIPIRQKLVNTLHPLHHLIDRRGRSSTHEQIERLIRSGNRHSAPILSVLRNGRSIAEPIERPPWYIIPQNTPSTANNFA